MATRRIFVSHVTPSPAEIAWSDAFIAALRSRGLDVFEQRMDESDPSIDVVGHALRESDLIVLLMNANTIDTPTFFFEFGVAIGGDKDLFAVIPEDLDPNRLPILPLRKRHVLKKSPATTAESLLARLHELQVA